MSTIIGRWAVLSATLTTRQMQIAYKDNYIEQSKRYRASRVIAKIYISNRVLFFVAFLFFKNGFSQTIFISTLNTTGSTKKISQTNIRYPGYYFEWSVGESSIITTNAVAGFQVTHGLLQSYLINPPTFPTSNTWFPDEIKIYPNPVVSDFTVEMLTAVKGLVEFTIIDMKGSILYRRSINYQVFGQVERFKVAHLPAGNYLLRAVIKGSPDPGSKTLKDGGFKIIKL